MTNDQLRTGRRPGRPDTRARILDVARKKFAQNGFDKTTVRAIGSEAQVDAALIHHYFGTKQQLFAASIELPVDPAVVIGPIRNASTEDIGVNLATAVLTVWESPHRAAVIAAFRSAMAGDKVELIRSFLLEVVLREIIPRVDQPPGTGLLRVQLVAAQMSGLLVTRYVLELEPLASLPVEELVPIIAPTLQRYLTGDL